MDASSHEFERILRCRCSPKLQSCYPLPSSTVRKVHAHGLKHLRRCRATCWLHTFQRPQMLEFLDQRRPELTPHKTPSFTFRQTKQTKKSLHVLWKQTWKPGANAIGAAAIDMATVFVCDVFNVCLKNVKHIFYHKFIKKNQKIYQKVMWEEQKLELHIFYIAVHVKNCL